MKWVTLLKDLKQKVGISQPPSSSAWPLNGNGELDVSTSLSRDNHGLELDFKRSWEEFRSFTSEEEKEESLIRVLDVFCRLVEQQANIAHSVTALLEANIFSFVVGRAFVTYIAKLNITNETRSYDVKDICRFFSEACKDGVIPGSNMLYAVEVLVSGLTDKQPLLDSGILCCLIHILNALLIPDGSTRGQIAVDVGESTRFTGNHDGSAEKVFQHELERRIVHIMKELASHPSAAQSLIEDDSLQLLFKMVASGSRTVYPQCKESVVLVNIVQLHHHALQILRLLLVNDNGSTTKYMHNHNLIKCLIAAIKDFDPVCDDSAYTVGLAELLLNCVELSYRPDSGGIRLTEDVHNAHGYQLLVQFAMILSTQQKCQDLQPVPVSPSEEDFVSDSSQTYLGVGRQNYAIQVGDTASPNICPTLSRLLDVLCSLAQTGPNPVDPTGAHRVTTSNSSHTVVNGHGRIYRSFCDKLRNGVRRNSTGKVKDLEAVRMLQDIFLKTDSIEVQAEVLRRIFKIFSYHLDNYKLCQNLRILPLFIINMARFPTSLQEVIVKIVEYAVTVVHCVPEQELLSLCCLLQQPITSDLKYTILSFFIKVISFDRQYRRVLREVGVMEVLLDDLKHNRFLTLSEHYDRFSEQLVQKSNSSNFHEHNDKKNAVISSSDLSGSSSGKFLLFENESTISVAWECIVILLRNDDASQAAFRLSSGVSIILPFLASETHHNGALQTLSCLISEDITQAHQKELCTLIDVLKSGVVSNVSGSHYKLQSDGICDTLGALWDILRVNQSAQRIFAEATGFSLLLTTLYSFQSDEGCKDGQSLQTHMKVFRILSHVVTAGVCGNAVNRLMLHSVILSDTFCDLLSGSGLLCMAYEQQVTQLFIELSLEIVIQPSPDLGSGREATTNMIDGEENFLSSTGLGTFSPDEERIYNASALVVLMRSFLLFTPNVQLQILRFIEELARASPFNQESLTSIGYVGLLLEKIRPFLLESSPLLDHAMQIVEVLAAYRLSPSELRVLLKYIMEYRLTNSGRSFINMMVRLTHMEDTLSNIVSLAPYIEMDMREVGHASVQVSLGERSWPPAAGYSFLCWFQYRGLLKSKRNETDQTSKPGSSKHHSTFSSQQPEDHTLRIFSIGTADEDSTICAELYLQSSGVLTLATSKSCSLSFTELELDEGRWHHLAVVHSKPNTLAGFYQASVAYLYVNGKLRHTGKLGYSPSAVGKKLQVTIGMPSARAKVGDLSWRLRCCYLFEEVLTSGNIFFIYILGRGYRGLFQDADLLQFIPYLACTGVNMIILNSLDTELELSSHKPKLENSKEQESTEGYGSGIFWDLARLRNLSLQLYGKKFIFAFDGTSSEVFRSSGTLSMLNLVDPMSSAASPHGGIPRFGHLHGDIYICGQRVIGDTIRMVGGMAVILGLIEAAETTDLLHMALSLLACTLHQNPQNLHDMQALRGYHLLALFLHRRMSLFDLRCLDILFQIAACEASFTRPQKLLRKQSRASRITAIHQDGYQDQSFPELCHGPSPAKVHGVYDEFLLQNDSSQDISGLDNLDMPSKASNYVVLSNADLVEHVLLDWTLWVTSPVSIQILLLEFLEQLVSMHTYRNHNLTVLRRIDLVQHLLVILQRGDVEVSVLDKLIVLLGVILEDGFLGSELEQVVRFVIMTFHPPELTPGQSKTREAMGKHVIVRNMLLEMLIDLQMTINSEDLLEQWHRFVSSKLITYFLDEAVSPTTMRWIMTLFGVCIASSPTFSHKFLRGGGYQSLKCVLPSFYDSPDIYYIIFCLMFGKPIYPRLPEVCMLDFHALIPKHGNCAEIKFVELLGLVVAMAKSTFDKLSMQSMLAHQNGNCPQVNTSSIPEVVERTSNTEEHQDEALMHRTYSDLLINGEAAAPSLASSVLQFMVDLVKTCPPFSAICRRQEFLESCVDLYFSCVRSICEVKLVEDLQISTKEATNNLDVMHSSQQTISGNTLMEAGKRTKHKCGSNMEVDILDVDSNFTQLKNGNPNIGDDQSVQDSDGGNYVVKEQIGAASAMGSFMHATENDVSQNPESLSQGLHGEKVLASINPRLLTDVDDRGYSGGPSAAGATAVLDFMAEVLADIVAEHIKPAYIESILVTVPLYVDVDSMLVFQGLCLKRLMNFFERRLFRDDEEDQKKLDKNIWSANLDMLCSMIVDRVYIGCFPKPDGVIGTLDFLLSMLQLVNKDGRIEEAAQTGKGLLFIRRRSKQLDPYMHTLLRNMNRMIMYCFLPSFLTTIAEEDLLSFLGLQYEPGKRLFLSSSEQECGIDISSVLQLLVAHKRIIFCPSNNDLILYCSLTVNLISLVRDKRKNAKAMAVDAIKYMLVHHLAALEELLVLKPNQGQHMDVLTGGFDKLLTGDPSEFFEWFRNSGQKVKNVLEEGATKVWKKHISESEKFCYEKREVIEDCRKREIGRRVRDTSIINIRHWELMNERRYALELVYAAMSTELKIVRQDKYGWVLHAESEWQTHLQQLVHERGISPMLKASTTDETEWQLCPIEGPYRMRKKLQRCTLKIDTMQNVLYEPGMATGSKKTNETSLDIPENENESFSHLLFKSAKCLDCGKIGDSLPKAIDTIENHVPTVDRLGRGDDQHSSIIEASPCSDLEAGAQSSAASIHISDNMHTASDIGSPMQSFMKNDEMEVPEDKFIKELCDNGEYLIRPYLEPFEKIRVRYNCERVVGLDKHDGIFLIGEHCLYVIENFYIDDSGCIHEKEFKDKLSVIDQALGVKKDVTGSTGQQSSLPSPCAADMKEWVGGRVWAYSGGSWGKERTCTSGNLPHPWCMWKLDSVNEILKRDYQLRPVAIEIFSTDGRNDLLVFHKRERDEVLRNLVAMNLRRNKMLDTTISGSSKQDGADGSRLFKVNAKSFSKRWQYGEISNFQYLMHLNTLAGRGYSDLTQYPVFPWVLADYESETLDLSDENTFRKLDKPMGCQLEEREKEFKKRYESWDDPDIPKFHYGSHYSSAGTILFYLVRLPPFSTESQKLQGGQFDHADRLFNSVKDTWLSASGKSNTSDVKELIPEFFYLPDFLENRFNLDLGKKQSGEKVCDVILPPWAKGSSTEFIRKHREALESEYVSENLHHWIDLIFGYKQKGKEAVEAVNVFYHYTYEGSVDIDSIADPAMKLSILAQINHFGQTPRQLFVKPHVKRRSDRKLPPHPLRRSNHLMPSEIRKTSSSINQIVTYHEKILLAGTNNLLKPKTYNKYIAWGFPDRSLRFMSYDQDRVLSTHESLHGGNQIQCGGVSHDGQTLVTGGEDSVICVWRIRRDGPRNTRRLHLHRTLCAHRAKITCLHVCQPYMMIVSGSEDCTVIVWDLSSLIFVRQLPKFPKPVSAIYVNDLTGEIVTATGILLAIWNINGDCLAVINTSQLPSDIILSVTSAPFSDWLETNWYVTGHQSGIIKVWHMVHFTDMDNDRSKQNINKMGGLQLSGKAPEYRLVLHKVLKSHKYPVTALHFSTDLRQFLSGDSDGHLLSWTLPDETVKSLISPG